MQTPQKTKKQEIIIKQLSVWYPPSWCGCLWWYAALCSLPTGVLYIPQVAFFVQRERQQPSVRGREKPSLSKACLSCFFTLFYSTFSTFLPLSISPSYKKWLCRNFGLLRHFYNKLRCFFSSYHLCRSCCSNSLSFDLQIDLTKVSRLVNTSTIFTKMHDLVSDMARETFQLLSPVFTILNNHSCATFRRMVPTFLSIFLLSIGHVEVFSLKITDCNLHLKPPSLTSYNIRGKKTKDDGCIAEQPSPDLNDCFSFLLHHWAGIGRSNFDWSFRVTWFIPFPFVTTFPIFILIAKKLSMK